MELPNRKRVRLKCFDYNTPGYYFITVCTIEKQKILCTIVGTGLLDGPKIFDTEFGKIARKQLDAMSDFYPDIKIDKYVIMPNHIHMLLKITEKDFSESEKLTPANVRIARFIGTFKRFCNKAYGKNIWQSRSYDHVIRGEQDYREIWQYIDNNPVKWNEDRFYSE